MGIVLFINRVLDRISKRVIDPVLAGKRRKKLKSTDFTIISNNCWGGVVYEYFGLPKQSPTVGAYFFASDYVKFCSNLHYYLGLNLELITADDSHNKEALYKKNQQGAIIGRIDDVEIVFLHYHNKKELLEKWERRKKRVNWDKIILKFSFQNDCSDELVRSFMKIPAYKKICFVGGEVEGCPDVLYYPRHNDKKETVDETYNLGRWFNIVDLINNVL